MTKTKASNDAPFCSCGCGKRTKGGNFRMGHDMRLRGLILRAETLAPVARRFVDSQPKSSEWVKLRVEGIRRVGEQAEREKAREQAREEREARKRSKTRGQKPGRNLRKPVRRRRPAAPPAPAEVTEVSAS